MENQEIVNDKRKYELSFWVKDGDDFSIKEIRNLISNFSVEIESEDDPRRSSIAQPIDKESFGLLVSFIFNADPDVADKIAKELQIKKYALRFMLVKNPINKEHQPRRRSEPSKNVNRISENKVVDGRDKHGAVTNEELEKKLEEILN